MDWSSHIAVATWALFFATALLAVFAYLQTRAIRDENRRQRTLDACTQYDRDPIIADVTRRLAAARKLGLLETSPSAFDVEITELLNYYDTIAIGISAGLYDEPLARRHMSAIIERDCALYMNEEYMRRVQPEMSPADFPALLDLRREWTVPRIYYQGSFGWYAILRPG